MKQTTAEKKEFHFLSRFYYNPELRFVGGAEERYETYENSGRSGTVSA